MGYSVWSPRLGCSMIFTDAETKNQARAAYKRYLRRMDLSPGEMKRFMTGIVINEFKENNNEYMTYLKIK